MLNIYKYNIGVSKLKKMFEFIDKKKQYVECSIYRNKYKEQ